MPSPSGRKSVSRAERKKLILAPVLLGTVLSCGITALLSWQGFIYPQGVSFHFSLRWWLAADLGAGAGLFVMTAVICCLVFYVMNRKRMK